VIEYEKREEFDFLLRNEADISARHRIRAILDFLDIQPGERVLDCGCGLGFHLEVVSHLVDCRLTGLDFEVQRVLKPGGILAITVPHHNYPFLWDPVNWTRERIGLEPIRKGFFGGLWTNHERLYRRADLVDLVESAGLVPVEVRQSVHYCFPFSHNLVYGLGKWLVESGRLPSADRFAYHEKQPAPLNPVHLGLGLFQLIDRLNDPVSDEGKVTVSLSLKARKP
jgi:SAM-dependent methyltransferase